MYFELLGSRSQKQKFKGSNSVWAQEFETVNCTYVLGLINTGTGIEIAMRCIKANAE